MKLDEERVRGTRERLGLTLAMVAQRAGTSKNTVLSAEHGGDIRPTTARKIAEALEVEITDLIGEQAHPLAEAPPSQQLSLNGLLAEERGADATIREGVHLRDHVGGCLDRWERVARGDDPHIAPDHAYAIEVSQHVIDLTAWLGNLARAAKDELPPEVAATEHREIVRLIDRMIAVAAEIAVIADAAEGITAEAVDAEGEALAKATAHAIAAKRAPANELARQKAEGSRRVYEAISEVQRSANEAKRAAAS